MTIREWRYEDILRISELEKEIFKEPWSYKTFATLFDLPTFYSIVAEEAGEIIGYGCLQIPADTADLENLGVAEEYRRSGVGRALLEALLEHCKSVGVKKVTLEVRVSNAPAMKLYLGHGFAGMFARPHYYQDGEDCIVMGRDL
ncbi:MAG: ribosomal protein S18-alanine N-acetyltransferase [Clostridia bacterium]|nr:ribosomal protein S18-alanine N-acetyltransferase [Clostridia bacterium]